MNYGSGTPAEAAAWVRDARSTPGHSVALWEVGNENCGCWEVNNPLAGPPENYPGYTPNTYTSVNGVYENPTCPQVTQGDAAGTQTLATSYAVNALPFLRAMKNAAPSAQIGVPWAAARAARQHEHFGPGRRPGLPVPAARRKAGGRLPQHQHQHRLRGDGAFPGGLSGPLHTWTYSAGNQDATSSRIVQGTADSASFTRGITLPPESMVILQTR